MILTTGAILRRITDANLSAASHKLATIILDGIAWKDGFNGLARGTAAFTLRHLASKMGVSRQHLTALLAELSDSSLQLFRWKPNGKYAPWLFRFGAVEDNTALDIVSAPDDTSLSIEKKNKTIFTGKILIGAEPNAFQTSWAGVIQAMKTSLPCWNVDTQVIWDRFLAFNRARGNEWVPAGYLLGFMRRWRNAPGSVSRPASGTTSQQAPDSRQRDLHEQIKAAPSSNRQFHASDLLRLIGQPAYDARVLDVIRQFECARFTATLAVHGRAVLNGEISR